MHPVFARLGVLTIHWYGVMMALGFSVGLLNWTVLGKKEGKKFDYCSDLLFWIMVSGIAGARLAYVISSYKHFLVRPIMEVFYIHKGGLIYYGGFLGSGLAIVLFARARKEKLLAVLDFVITSVPLAHCFGRIGCFLQGCCFGKLTDSSCSVVYPYRSGPWIQQWKYDKVIASYDKVSLPVYPVQLYESAMNLLLFVFLFWVFKKRKGNGLVVAAYLLTYPVARYWIELLRGDERMMLMGLTVAQVVSLGLFALGCVILFIWKKNQGAGVMGKQ